MLGMEKLSVGIALKLTAWWIGRFDHARNMSLQADIPRCRRA